MIVSKIYGGLAGQMLQYAAGRHLSLKHGAPLYLDTIWYDYNQNDKYPRNFKLDKLNTHFKLIDHHSIYWKLKFTEKFKSLNPFKLKIYKEEDINVFDPAFLKVENPAILDGFFFSHKYFYPILDTLKVEFSVKDKLDERNQQQLQIIQNTNAVSIHIRRGDYALTDFHGMLELDYYKKAIDLLKEKYSDLHLFLFSDEPEWIVNNMQFDDPFTVIDYNKDEHNYIDIELMKNCKHNIIANSGFSWWGAVLNKNNNPTVIAPAKWINADNSRFENMPADWILL